MAESSKDNGRKAKHGANARESLRKVIEDLKEFGALSESVSSPQYGYEGYDPAQFDAHEEVTYPDDTKAILYATTTLRSDRVETDQWRAHNIKQVDPQVEYAFIVLPDEKGYDKGTSTRDRIRDGEVVSAIDDIVTLQEFYDRTIAKYSESMESGASHDLQGRKLEELFAAILSDRENWNRYNGNETCTGYLYDVFHMVMRKLSVDRGSIRAITATTEIPALPSGGNPKTDILALVELEGKEPIKVTFSLKNTSNKSVSVHEYSADTFADVLDPNNAELRRLLNAFQKVGNKRDMLEEDILGLTEELAPYLEKLNRWVFSGEGAPGVIPNQIAQYIVVRDKNSGAFSIHTVDEYCERQETEIDGSKWFGTIFSWTFPSKKRGSKIQLKARILM